MPLSPTELKSFLRTHEIQFEEYAHPAVFTCEEAQRATGHIPGIRTKNLFLTSKQRDTFFLVTTTEGGRTNLKALAGRLDTQKLSFGNEEELQRMLGISAGHVSLLSAINDTVAQVKVYLDRAIWTGAGVHCHPLTNSETLLLTPPNIEKFFKIIQHAWTLIDVPK